MSKVKLKPSKSNAVNVPATELRPPIILELPSCSKSMLAVALDRDWETGERYQPEKAIKSLSASEYAATTKAKREGTKKGKQFVKQPKSVARKVRKYRKVN